MSLTEESIPHEPQRLEDKRGNKNLQNWVSSVALLSKFKKICIKAK